MTQMPAMVKLHRQHSVARLQQRHIDGGIGLGARMGLHVGMFCTKKRQRTLDANLLGDVNVLAAAVISPSRIALGILVRQNAARRRQHLGENVILAGNQFDSVRLPLTFGLNRRVDLRIPFPEQLPRIRLIGPV